MYSRRPSVIDHHENDLEVDEKGGVSTIDNRLSTDPTFPAFTFARSLRIGMYRPGLPKRLLAPFLALRLPGVWLIALWYSGLVGGIVAASFLGAQLVSSPPYLWGEKAGLINVGGIVGGVLGLAATALTADWYTKRQAKKETHG